MDNSDRYKVSEQDAEVWTLIYKLIRAAQGDPFEASRRVAELIAPVLADAEKWRRFLAIQSCNDCPACPECPCDETNCPAIKIEDAFEGEGGKS
jgi:hypothetical protein